MEKEPHSTFMLGDRSFDFVKKLVQIVLPACGALYFGLSQIWGFPEAEKVVGTIAVIQTFLGVILGISTAQYNASGKAFDGNLTVEAKPDGPPQVKGMHFDGMPEDLEGKKSITLKIQQQLSPDVLETDEPIPVKKPVPRRKPPSK